MCIRDRASIQSEILHDTADGVRFSPDGRTLAAAITGLRGCLLYTSDAADERSSVDLGGRRIIKKKKTVTTRGQLCTKRTSINVNTIRHTIT